MTDAQQTTRFLVLSDLHAFMGQPDDKSPSLMGMDPTNGGGASLMEKCSRVVKDRFEYVDAVLVGGDLTNGADGSALKLVWAQLNALAADLGARLIATAGNHDYDSRSHSSPNARGELIALSPPFPSGSEESKLQYFTYDYCLETVGSVRLVVLNSAAQHGYTLENAPEYEHGRITRQTMSNLQVAISATTDAIDNFVLVHHHPSQLPGLDHSEASTMLEGEELLTQLEQSGEWFVIHGHKHRPLLRRAAGEGDSPILFSAGSFSANTGGLSFGAAAPNQFYVLETATPAAREGAGASTAGTIYTWTYDSFDWQPSGINDPLPAQMGYGWRGSLTILAKSVLDELEKAGGVMAQDAIYQAVPQLAFVTYTELKSLRTKIQQLDNHATVSFDTNGRLLEIAISVPAEVVS